MNASPSHTRRPAAPRAPGRWCALAACALLWGTTGALAQGSGTPAPGGIYTCIDAHGRRLTSDRPIPACIDREQRELNRDGTVRRIIPPTLTATEREAHEAREREAALKRQRERDIQRRDQALITRYPDKAAHDAGRAEELAQTQIVIQAAEHRITELGHERKALDDEMEFYAGNPAKAPAKLRRALTDNAEAVATQRRAIAAQHDEQRRIHARFDAEALRLQPLWAARPGDAPRR